MFDFHITSQELKLVLVSGVLGFLWMIFAVPYFIQAVWFQKLNPGYEYVIYNVGLFGLTTAIFGIPLGRFAEGNQHKILRAGVSSFVSLSWTWDLLQPPFYLDPSGHVAITNTGALSGPAVDTMFSYVWGLVLPQVVDTPNLYYLVYVLSPVLGLILAAFILKPSKFRKLLRI